MEHAPSLKGTSKQNTMEEGSEDHDMTRASTSYSSMTDRSSYIQARFSNRQQGKAVASSSSSTAQHFRNFSPHQQQQHHDRHLQVTYDTHDNKEIFQREHAFLQRCNVIVQWYHYFMFTFDTYPVRPLLWSGLWLSYEIYFQVATEYNVKGIFHILINFFPVIYNLYFGYRWNKSHGISRLLALYHKHQLTDEDCIYWLNLSSYIGVILVLIYQLIFATTFALQHEDQLVLNIAINAFSLPCRFILYGVYFHICSLWATSLWSLCRGVQNSAIAKLPTPLASSDEEVVQEQKKSLLRSDTATSTANTPNNDYDRKLFEATVYDMIDDMTQLSNEWQLNHIIRVIFSFFFALNFFSSDDIGTIYMASVYFCVMWATAIMTSFTNDNFFHSIQVQLANISSKKYFYTNPTITEDHIRTLLLRIRSLYETRGLHFGGFRFSVQRSFSVGSFLLTIIIFFLKTY